MKLKTFIKQLEKFDSSKLVYIRYKNLVNGSGLSAPYYCVLPRKWYKIKKYELYADTCPGTKLYKDCFDDKEINVNKKFITVGDVIDNGKHFDQNVDVCVEGYHYEYEITDFCIKEVHGNKYSCGLCLPSYWDEKEMCCCCDYYYDCRYRGKIVSKYRFLDRDASKHVYGRFRDRFVDSLDYYKSNVKFVSKDSVVVIEVSIK